MKPGWTKPLLLISLQELVYFLLGFSLNFLGSVANVKVIRDKKTGLSLGKDSTFLLLILGYGFVEFTSHRAAQEVLISLNGTTVPGTNKYTNISMIIYVLES